MRSERRLARLEASLPPREAVIRWLVDVHGHRSVEAYVAGLLDDPSATSPLVALTEQARAAARASHARESRSMVREAEQRAVADVLFVLLLVIELEHEATETIRIGSLRLEALRWEHRARNAEGTSARREWAAWSTGVRDLATDLARTETVRRSLADRYLDGREVLSSVTLAAWRALRDGATPLVETTASLPGGRRRRRTDSHAIGGAAERTASEEARRLVERVRARTLDLLGDHAGAARIVERALRGTA